MSHDQELQAFGQLVEQHHAAVAAVAFATTRDLALAEDVAQDTFIVAWSQRERLSEAARVRPWLCGIARNLGRHALRRRSREVGANDDQLTDPSPTALDGSIDREALHELRAALATLPAPYRESLVLFYWEERSIAQVASTLAITEVAAQKRISRGRALLREGIEDRIEHVGRRRRRARDVAASVIAVVLAPAGAAEAIGIKPAVAIGPSWAKLAFHALAPAAVVGALVIAYLPARRDEPARCSPNEVVLDAHASRLRELANAIVRNAFDDRARDEQIAALSSEVSSSPDQAAASAPAAPRQRTRPPTKIAASRPIPRPEAPAAEPLSGVTPPHTVTRPAAPTCDAVACILENFAGACCQALEAKITKLPSSMPGYKVYDLSNVRP